MATVVESEEVKTDEEKAVKKVVEEENEPESAGGCDVCLPPNGLIGCSSYNYKYLCLPSMPWSRGGVAPPQFLGKDARLPLLLALVMGFQHALAMVAGMTESETTRTCANDNGRCCNHYNKREDSHRTTLIILLKTPYAIGTIAALFLHLLLPEDRVLDEEKEHYPRAFSDDEIAYET